MVVAGFGSIVDQLQQSIPKRFILELDPLEIA
jgi:hypothetical protein